MVFGVRLRRESEVARETMRRARARRRRLPRWRRLLPGATVLIDRHYDSLQPYHRSEQNMYAVRKGEGSTVRSVELVGQNLVLRPHNTAYPVDLIEVEEGKTLADYIAGRVAHVAIET